jgi:hypothetical protein
MRNYSELIYEFYRYVHSFYNLETGVYPIATDSRIQECVNQYLETKPSSQIYFDSFDREQVRELIGL